MALESVLPDGCYGNVRISAASSEVSRVTRRRRRARAVACSAAAAKPLAVGVLPFRHLLVGLCCKNQVQPAFPRLKTVLVAASSYRFAAIELGLVLELSINVAASRPVPA